MSTLTRRTVSAKLSAVWHSYGAEYNAISQRILNLADPVRRVSVDTYSPKAILHHPNRVHEHSQRERRVEHFQCPSSMGCVKYMHDVAETCDNEWCIARGGAWWFDYGFIGNIRCARVHVWFRIAIDGVHCVVARDVRDALDGNNVWV